jgi:hypothetical protein
MNEWQPIETAPKDGRRVLVLNHGEDVRIAKFGTFKFEKSEGTGWMDCENPEWFLANATHWMPIPDPPSKCEPTP